MDKVYDIDPKTKKKIFEILDGLYKQGHTIIITTHNIDFASEWSDEFVIMGNGEILRHGDKDIFLDSKLLDKANIDLPIVTNILI